MNIKGTALFNANISNVSGALYVSRKDLKNENGSGGNNGDELAIDASKNWTGSTSEENSHTHTFSSSATIGSGNYTRPNSTSTLIIIRY